MTTSPEGVLIKKILARHGARRDLRMWRNETALGWVGVFKGRTEGGFTVLQNAVRILTGLCKGSADLIGIMMVPTSPLGYEGVFFSLEVKTANTKTEDHQTAWLEMVRSLGGIAEIVRSVEDVDEILGRPPQGRKT